MEVIFMDAIRKQAEMCSSFAGVFIFHSMGGGTGSGLTTLLMQKLATEFLKKHKLEFVIYPSPRVSAIYIYTFSLTFSFPPLIFLFFS